MKYFALIVLLVTTQARAEFFACTFTEPFFGVYVSTKHKIATYDGPFLEFEPGNTITSVTEENSIVEMVLSNGAKMIVDRNIPGSDGMSDVVYPYEVRHIQGDQVLYGGCTGE